MYVVHAGCDVDIALLPVNSLGSIMHPIICLQLPLGSIVWVVYRHTYVWCICTPLGFKVHIYVLQFTFVLCAYICLAIFLSEFMC